MEADWLSRPSKAAEVPQDLTDLKIRPISEDWMMVSCLDPPGVNAELWGKDPQSLVGFDCLG